MLDTNFLATWFTGKALTNAVEAMNLLNESITLGYWAPKASVKVPAALGKSNVAKKLSESSKEIVALAADYNHPARQIAWEIKHNMYFGSHARLAQLDMTGLVVETAEAKNLVAKAQQFAADFAPINAAIETLNKESEANKKLAKAQQSGSENPMGICPCCFRAQKVKPSGTMFVHGYERPGYGYIIGGCPGDMFKPYEA